MSSVLKNVTAPIVSLIILMTGSGLFMTLVTIRLRQEEINSIMIGAVTAAYYAGLFLGCFRAEKFIMKVGHIRAYSALAAFTAIICVLMGFWINPWLWILFRFLGGACLAGLFVSIESWLLVKSSEKTRGSILAVYMISLYGASAAGQFLLDIASPSSLTPFALVGALSSLSIIPLSLTKNKEPMLESHSLLSLKKLTQVSPLGFIGAFLSGMILAALYGLSPIYAQEIGMNLSEIATFMGISLLGGLTLQWPLGFLSDRRDRRIILCFASFSSAILAILIALTGYHFPHLVLLFTALFGGFSFTLYPLSISHACDFFQPKDIVGVTGALLLSYGIGAVMGPLVAPFLMKLFDPEGLYYYFAAISILLGLITLLRMAQKPPVPQREKLPFTNIPRTSPIAGELDPRQEEESPSSSQKNPP